jgi:predicted metal-dependent hydrolase
MRPGSGLEIVIPKGLKNLDIHDILERHKVWILRAGKRVPGGGAVSGAGFPERVALHGGLVCVPVRREGEARSRGMPGYYPLPVGFDGKNLKYSALDGDGSVIVPARGRPHTAYPLTVPDGGAAGMAALRVWVREYARRFLCAWLAWMGDAHGLRPDAVGVRLQKTRWGSCSAKGKVNLNASLVFLPPELCRHILLHELCHLRHMNHGEGFWKLLFSLEPDAAALDARLRQGWRYVPAWVWE